MVYVSAFEETAFTQAKDTSTKDLLSLLLASEATMTKDKLSTIQEQLQVFILHLKQEKSKYPSDKKYLRWVVQEVRHQFLHHYDLYPSFHQLFTNGTYNCLSGTALYALVLEQLHYPVEIHETAFHAYLIIRGAKQEFLLDATDAENGFAYYAYQIQAREALYRENERARYQPAFNRVISFQELAGLHYYNEALLQFNAQNYSNSLIFLAKAAQLYPRSERIHFLQTNALQNQQKFEAAQIVKKSNRQVRIQDEQTSGLSQK
jgi:tetratricopeptide (TPR) repeat protein